MKAITLHQPWASLIAEGVKTIETRGREHPWRSAIGEIIAIHAGKPSRALNYAAWMEEHQDEPEPILSALRERGFRIDGDDTTTGLVRADHDLPLGAMVAICTLRDVVPVVGVMTGDGPDDHDAHQRAIYLLPDAVELVDRYTLSNDPGHAIDVSDQRPFGEFVPGRWALVLDDIVKLREPVPARGHQGLWALTGREHLRVVDRSLHPVSLDSGDE